MNTITKNLFIFFFCTLSLPFAWGQVGAKCDAAIKELYPRKLFDLSKLGTGEWMITATARRNASLVVPPQASCMSQVLSPKEGDEKALNIRLKLNVIANGAHMERDGQVNLGVTDNSAIWRWSYFDNPGEFWDGVVIATDYDNYWIHYECEEVNGMRLESAVVRTRSRTPSPELKKIYASLIEGLGFPLTHIVDIPHTNCEGTTAQAGKPGILTSIGNFFHNIKN